MNHDFFPHQARFESCSRDRHSRPALPPGQSATVLARANPARSPGCCQLVVWRCREVGHSRPRTFVKGRTMNDVNSTRRMPENMILGSLSPDEQSRLSGKLQPVDLEQGRIIYEASMPIDDVYFIDEGMVSV